MTHTQDQLQELDGAGLNRLVAGELGWTEVRYMQTPDGHDEVRGCVPETPNFRQNVPNWAGDIGAAWELVETQFPDASIDLTVRTNVSPNIRQRDYFCDLFTGGGAVIGYQTTLGRARGDTAAVAIVRAFLLAKIGGGRGD